MFLRLLPSHSGAFIPLLFLILPRVRLHFHPNYQKIHPVHFSSQNWFVHRHFRSKKFHPKTVSSKTCFIQKFLPLGLGRFFPDSAPQDPFHPFSLDPRPPAGPPFPRTSPPPDLPKISRFVFPSAARVRFFLRLSLGVFSLNCGHGSRPWTTQIVRLGSLGSFCETIAACPPPFWAPTLRAPSNFGRCKWVKLSLDEIEFGRLCRWMKTILDESAPPNPVGHHHFCPSSSTHPGPPPFEDTSFLGLAPPPLLVPALLLRALAIFE